MHCASYILVTAELSDLKHTMSLNSDIFWRHKSQDRILKYSVLCVFSNRHGLLDFKFFWAHLTMSYHCIWAVTVLSSCAVTAAKTGRGAEAAGGARPAGGEDSTAGRGGATENPSWGAEGWAGDSEKETSCQYQGSDKTTNTRSETIKYFCCSIMVQITTTKLKQLVTKDSGNTYSP